MNVYFTTAVFLLTMFFSAKAQTYTLTDNDVVVTNGTIISCSYSFALKDIIIPNELDGQIITAIGDDYQNLFSVKGITSVQLPSTLESIGNGAFTSNNLSSLTISNSVKFIGHYAFTNNNISSVVFDANSSIIQIGRNAFLNNGSLHSVTLPINAHPNFVEYIDSEGNVYMPGDEMTDFTIFYRTRSPYVLTDNDVVVTNGTIISCSYSFELKDIIIPNVLDGQTVIAIGDDYENLFSNKDIYSVQLTSALERIGEKAFQSNNLISLIFDTNSSVMYIGAYAFYNNSLISIRLPNSVTFVGDMAFEQNLFSKYRLPDPLSPLYYNFLGWNGYISGGTYVTDLTISYTAEFIAITEGVYIGITGFNGQLNTTESLETDGMLVLNEDGIIKNQLNSFINNLNLEQDDNSALYAAMGKGINILENAEFPKLDDVFLITFTDGLDNFSNNLTPIFTSLDIQAMVMNNLVDSINIQSFTIGYTNGMSSTMQIPFERDLTDLSSQSEDFFVSNNLDEISDYFSYISKQLVDINEISLLECRIPVPEDNTQIRWTFDVEGSEITSPQVYIEATVRRTGTFPELNFRLEDVVYNGLNSSTQTSQQINGENIYENSNFVGIRFQFQDFTINQHCEGNVDSVKYWTYSQDNELWVTDTESNAGDIVSVEYEKKNIAVMLILDCSNSLGSQFNDVKNIAKEFIDNLQNDYYSMSSSKNVVKVNVNPQIAGISVTFDGETKETNAFGQAYFVDKYEGEYNYTVEYQGETRSASICVYQPTQVSVNFEAGAHIVTFKDWDDFVIKTEFVEIGNSATAPKNPKRTGYIFSNWDEDFSSVISDLVVTAKYNKESDGINNIKLKDNIILFPNPATTQLTVTNNKSEIGNIIIIDLTGKVIRSITTNDTNKTIDVSDFPNGIYFVKIGTNVFKFIKS